MAGEDFVFGSITCVILFKKKKKNMYMSSGYPPRGGYGGAQSAPAGDAWQGLSQLMQQAQMIDITNAKSHLMDVQSNSGNKPTSPWCLTPRLNTLSFSDGEFFFTRAVFCVAVLALSTFSPGHLNLILHSWPPLFP